MTHLFCTNMKLPLNSDQHVEEWTEYLKVPWWGDVVGCWVNSSHVDGPKSTNLTSSSSSPASPKRTI